MRVAAGTAAPPPVRPLIRATNGFRAETMTRGTDGSAWMATRHSLVRLAPDGRRTVFHPAGGVEGAALAPAADGGVWFSPRDGLARLSPNGRVRSYTHRLPRRAEPDELAPGAGGSVWYVDLRRNTVARVTATGHVREVRLGRHADPFGIAARPGGGVWVTDSHGAVERVSGGRVQRFHRTGTADVPAIATAPDGSAWFVDFTARRVAHITADGHISRYRTHGRPTSIAIGADGAAWFTTAAVSRHESAGVGRVDAAGHEREFAVHLTCDLSYLGLITGPDGNLWFAEAHGPVAVAELDPRRLTGVS